MLKLYLSSVIIALLSAGSAEAACSRAALAGSWTVLGTDGEDYCAATFGASGTIKLPCKNMGDNTSYYVYFAPTVSSSCLIGGTITLDGSTYYITGRAEQVTGELVPNTMMLRVKRNNVTWNSALIAYRN